MRIPITMANLGYDMETGKIVSWSKQVGDTVERGEVIAEVETDKTNVEMESLASGTLVEVTRAAGDEGPVVDGERVDLAVDARSGERAAPRRVGGECARSLRAARHRIICLPRGRFAGFGRRVTTCSRQRVFTAWPTGWCSGSASPHPSRSA